MVTMILHRVMGRFEATDTYFSYGSMPEIKYTPKEDSQKTYALIREYNRRKRYGKNQPVDARC